MIVSLNWLPNIMTSKAEKSFFLDPPETPTGLSNESWKWRAVFHFSALSGAQVSVYDWTQKTKKKWIIEKKKRLQSHDFFQGGK